MKFDRFLPIAIIYFFFNGFLLPMGMQYTILLTPLFYFWLLKNKQKNVIGYFIVAWAPWAIIHFFIGIDYFYYAKSTILLFTVYIFCFAFYWWVKNNRGLEKVFAHLMVFNFMAVLLALLIFFTPFSELLWTFENLTIDMPSFPRIRLLTYEPSYYATLMVPFVVYYLLGVLLKPYSIRTIAGLLVMILTPLVFSFSLGVIASLVMALVMVVALNFKSFITKRRVFYMFSGLVVVSIFTLLALIIFYPTNPLFERIGDLYSGKDTSAQGRTYYAFVLATQIAEVSNYWFGAGIGQIKIMGDAIIRAFYDLDLNETKTIRIPNTLGETIGTFGMVGLILRLGIEWYLFFKTKVWTNLYRLTLFIYIFIYQFTGSFLTNIAEYVIWVLAFTPCFTHFDQVNFRVSSKPTLKTDQS
ncbi:MAG: hypothetical protein CL840_16925 [Crocinitomicaceae bacterium]|nr:hypothetical protein [Crocinitomicaceae bacterium]|tara:strand:- start:147 stop:1385 length:1239 start_codon:yes stop_codon:yes gene_type:complete